MHRSVSHADRAILRSAYSDFRWIPPVVRRLFEVNSEPHTGARPSVRLCVGLINMHREATRNPHMVPWGWGEERKKILFLSLIFYKKNISI